MNKRSPLSRRLWRTAAAMAAKAREVLPAAGARIAVVGCGTSWFMAQSVAALREAGGLGETDAFTPTEMPAGRRYDAVVVISRSGTTTEIVRALRAVPPGTPTIAISAVPELTRRRRPPGAASCSSRPTSASVVQTRFATTALALFRASFGEDLESGDRRRRAGAGRASSVRPRRLRALRVPRPRLDRRPGQ